MVSKREIAELKLKAALEEEQLDRVNTNERNRVLNVAPLPPAPRNYDKEFAETGVLRDKVLEILQKDFILANRGAEIGVVEGLQQRRELKVFLQHWRGFKKYGIRDAEYLDSNVFLTYWDRYARMRGEVIAEQVVAPSYEPASVHSSTSKASIPAVRLARAELNLPDAPGIQAVKRNVLARDIDEQLHRLRHVEPRQHAPIPEHALQQELRAAIRHRNERQIVRSTHLRSKLAEEKEIALTSLRVNQPRQIETIRELRSLTKAELINRAIESYGFTRAGLAGLTKETILELVIGHVENEQGQGLRHKKKSTKKSSAKSKPEMRKELKILEGELRAGNDNRIVKMRIGRIKSLLKK